MIISNDVKQAIEALNQVRFPTPSGPWPLNGPGLGDMIQAAININPINVHEGIVDPSAGAGLEANVGDLYLRDAPGVGGGELWIKTGLTDTDWDMINTVAGTSLFSLSNLPASPASDIDCGGQSIINVFRVDGVDVSVIGGAGTYRTLNVVDNVTTDDDGNVDGLDSAILLCNSLLTTMNDHAADADEHFSVTAHTHAELATVNGTALGIITVADASAFLEGDEVIIDDDGTVGPTATVYIVGITDLGGPGPYELHIQDAPTGGVDVDLSAYLVVNSADVNIAGRAAADDVNFPVVGTASDLATLLALAGLLLTAYAAHNADAILATPAFHNATAADHSLVSAVTPTTLAEAIARLNDLKAKYNLHDADAAGHTTGGLYVEATADAANGASTVIADVNALAGDKIQWSILDDGAATVKGVSATADAGQIVFEFDTDPGSDVVLSYSLFRAN